MYTVLVANATAMIANVDPAAKEYKSKVLMGDTIVCSFYLKWGTKTSEQNAVRGNIGQLGTMAGRKVLLSWQVFGQEL